MTKTVLIEIKELYPFFGFGASDTADNPCEVDEKQLADWKKVMADFARVQAEMKAKVDPEELDPNDPKNTTVDGRGK